MRKNRFLALQKMAEQKKNEAMNATNAAMNDGGPPDHHGIPKQTVSGKTLLPVYSPSIGFLTYIVDVLAITTVTNVLNSFIIMKI